jgi:hypothetical protein
MLGLPIYSEKLYKRILITPRPTITWVSCLNTVSEQKKTLKRHFDTTSNFFDFLLGNFLLVKLQKKEMEKPGPKLGTSFIRGWV